MIVNITLGVILLIIVIILTPITVSALEDDNYIIRWFPIVQLIFTMLGMALICIDTSPKAIDVYKNKTTLEITYRDSVPVDSVVVYKK